MRTHWKALPAPFRARGAETIYTGKRSVENSNPYCFPYSPPPPLHPLPAFKQSQISFFFLFFIKKSYKKLYNKKKYTIWERGKTLEKFRCPFPMKWSPFFPIFAFLLLNNGIHIVRNLSHNSTDSRNIVSNTHTSAANKATSCRKTRFHKVQFINGRIFFLISAGCAIELREGKYQVHTGEPGVTFALKSRSFPEEA